MKTPVSNAVTCIDLFSTEKRLEHAMKKEES